HDRRAARRRGTPVTRHRPWRRERGVRERESGSGQAFRELPEAAQALNPGVAAYLPAVVFAASRRAVATISRTSAISVGTWYGIPSLIVHAMPPPWAVRPVSVQCGAGRV